jgi:hypothetical protein
MSKGINMWRKREIMEAQKTILDTLVEKVPTDVSGKWVNKDELKPFAIAVADYVLSRLENKTNDPTL